MSGSLNNCRLEREWERERALSVATRDRPDRWMERMTGCLANWKDNFHPHRLYAFACRLLSPSLIQNLKERKQELCVCITMCIFTQGGADFYFNFYWLLNKKLPFVTQLLNQLL